MTKAIKSLIASLSFAILTITLVNPNVVYADCEQNYGGGETCVYNKTFRIIKKARFEWEDDDEARDKVTDVEKGDVIVFEIEVKNEGEIEVDNMFMEDFLPSEMEFLDNEGLTEEWDDFEPGETKKFEIRAKVEDDEFNDENFEKCVVNKVEIEWDGDFEGSDTATVCYGDVEITELPETGPTSGLIVAITGFALISLGMLVRKRLA